MLPCDTLSTIQGLVDRGQVHGKGSQTYDSSSGSEADAHADVVAHTTSSSKRSMVLEKNGLAVKSVKSQAVGAQTGHGTPACLVREGDSRLLAAFFFSGRATLHLFACVLQAC